MRAVEVVDLIKKYKKNPKPAVAGLSFEVEQGEVFGLLGPNGAGKTTTVGILTTRVIKSAGDARVHGVDVTKDPATARQLLAVVPQRNNLDRSLNIRQNLLFHAAYHGMGRAERHRRADELLERMGLADRANDKVDIISGGQSQRIMIARALMHRPKVMFLDEPSTGLDPQARLFVHDRVKQLHDEGVTVVLTTHDMDEAAKLCDRVGIIDHGKLLALDSPAALTRNLPGSTTVSVTVSLDSVDPGKVTTALEEIPGVQRVEKIASGGPAMPPAGMMMGGPPPGAPPGGMPPQADETAGHFRLYTEVEPAVVLPAVLRSLGDLGCDVSDLSIGTPSLEDVFIHLTGRELR
ncbi:ABC transporter ATP-binding protein [Kibdelosporangium aridum]|uniref:ABC-2 type transport system ATP-binding protein n=1 Tax=Kibdelosporangium aridum TaxID=2030 RepID=A0A1W2F0R9_KIBAR|nr:ABC transporter ATP-binding protein [Kibdelosporangium aridum]SMD15520.1 ABC-2 type transport system ATP-binding protein [Kibdelosporangium aridum]